MPKQGKKRIKKRIRRIIHSQLTDEEKDGIWKAAAEAIVSNDKDKLDSFLKAYPDVVDHQYGKDTLLHIATINRQFKCVKLLLKYGSDVNAVNETSTTPLIISTRDKDIPISKLLLEYKAKVNVKTDSGSTPLHYASRNLDGNLELVQLLLESLPKSKLKRVVNACIESCPYHSVLDYVQIQEIRAYLISMGYFFHIFKK